MAHPILSDTPENKSTCLFFFCHDAFGICQDLIELAVRCGLYLAVVDLHTIVQVQLNTVQGKVGDHLIVIAALLELFLELFLPFGGDGHFTAIRAVVDHILHTANLGLVDPLHLVKVVHAEVADGVRRVAMEVDQGLEAVLLTAVKQPVDRALLVNFAVILEEVLEEIAADDLPAGAALIAKGFCDVIEVCFQRVSTVHCL